MKLYVIFGLRQPDEIEALDVIDEYGADENGAFLQDALEKHRGNPDLMDVRVVGIDVSRRKVLEVFDAPVISGEINP